MGIPNLYIVLIFGISLLVIILLSIFLFNYFSNPFKYPYLYIKFDITKIRNPSMNDFIDNYLIDKRMDEINFHILEIEKWKKESENQINKSIFKKKRKKQFCEVLDDNKMIVFIFYKRQTRYKQINYTRHPYKVTVEVAKFSTNLNTIKNRYDRLNMINFECTLNDYECKNQRNKMSKELRKEIMERDHYTCQICGKYMPDEVGLHIDHIIPISKGGKSVPSNLQVLCSKCNGRKSNK